MKKSYIVKPLAVFFLLLFCASSSYANKDMERLRKRFTEDLLKPEVNKEHIQNLVDTYQGDGKWQGIDYVDTTRTGFQHARHLSHLLSLSRAYKKPGSQYKGNRQVKRVFTGALDFWLEHDFICENWWNNQIGTPSVMVALLLIMDKELSAGQVEKMLLIAGRGHIGASGARPSGDRIKIAGIQAKCALFSRDSELFERLIKVIEGEIKFASPTERGMQYDYSFHHREDRVNNTLSYGLGYADTFAEWAANVADTRYRFSDGSMKLLIDYYLDGICKQMVYGRSDDTGIKNRDITRVQGRTVAGYETPRRLIEASGYRADELANIIKARKGEDFTIPSFAKFFWQSEHFVYQRPGFYTSVRMYSTRNCNMEYPYNGEGLMNHYRGDGTNYISVHGNEYTNLAPVYDWMRIPGATTMLSDEMPPENETQRYGLRDFTGGVTDGEYGAVAFDFKSDHNPLDAKKAWFFFDRQYVCLGAAIGSVSSRQVVTTLNQCRLNGDVTVKSSSGKEVLAKGQRSIRKVNWVHHDQVGYLFSKPDSVSLMNDVATGSWFRVNRQTSSSKEEVKENIFKLWLDHGSRLKSEVYEYTVMPGATVDEVEAYAARPEVDILSNTPDLQAARHNGLNMAYAVFYRSGEVKISEHLTIGMDSPGMLIVKYTDGGKKIVEISVSDPSRKLGRIHLTGNHPSIKHLAIDMPQSAYAGMSTTHTF